MILSGKRAVFLAQLE